MAIKKSELYSKLWASCDELRGGMDASQYKDYVLVLLFIKYISDKYDGQPYAPITIPKGASFKDMVALKGKTNIGELINTKIVGPLAKENKLSDMPDFDSEKLGSTGKEKAEKLTNLIAIFEDPALNFSKNRADGDDILGDAYEYLMRHFATESGKSKGQFYTPAEVSRIMAQILGIKAAKITAATTVYDPTCGSGSLLLKVGDEAGSKVTLYGQEKDSATSALARMNMILHNNPTAVVMQGNTLADPKFRDGNKLKQFDYVVANPPFSDKRWSTGIDPINDVYERFLSFGVPPGKQGDYAYLLHIIRSLKSTGKGACILPHGVLFRGGAEAEIRKNLIKKRYLKGIVGLPSNLFYGTGIPACIFVIDKGEAASREGVFIIEASQGFIKDDSKNRLRSQDIHKIVDVFNRQLDIPGYSRMVPYSEIENNEFYLNLPRYIDSQKLEEIQDITGHLIGGIPKASVLALEQYWKVCPKLKKKLFKEKTNGYFSLAIDKRKIKETILNDSEYLAFTRGIIDHFDIWKRSHRKTLNSLKVGCVPKKIISELSESILEHFSNVPLFESYDVYQHLMDYWNTAMQDDCYLISEFGWKAEPHRIIEKDKKGKEKDKGWTCELVGKDLIVARYFSDANAVVDKLTSDLELISASIKEIEEENSGEGEAFSELEKINRASVSEKLKEFKNNSEFVTDSEVLTRWIQLNDQESDLKRRIKEAESDIDGRAYGQYGKLKEADLKSLVVDDKWLASIQGAVEIELDRVCQVLSDTVRDLSDRYEDSLPELASQASAQELKLKAQLSKMGFAWLQT